MKKRLTLMLQDLRADIDAAADEGEERELNDRITELLMSYITAADELHVEVDTETGAVRLVRKDEP